MNSYLAASAATIAASAAAATAALASQTRGSEIPRAQQAIIEHRKRRDEAMLTTLANSATNRAQIEEARALALANLLAARPKLNDLIKRRIMNAEAAAVASATGTASFSSSGDVASPVLGSREKAARLERLLRKRPDLSQLMGRHVARDTEGRSNVDVDKEKTQKKRILDGLLSRRPTVDALQSKGILIDEAKANEEKKKEAYKNDKARRISQLATALLRRPTLDNEVTRKIVFKKGSGAVSGRVGAIAAAAGAGASDKGSVVSGFVDEAERADEARRKKREFERQKSALMLALSYRPTLADLDHMAEVLNAVDETATQQQQGKGDGAGSHGSNASGGGVGGKMKPNQKLSVNITLNPWLDVGTGPLGTPLSSHSSPRPAFLSPSNASMSSSSTPGSGSGSGSTAGHSRESSMDRVPLIQGFAVDKLVAAHKKLLRGAHPGHTRNVSSLSSTAPLATTSSVIVPTTQSSSSSTALSLPTSSSSSSSSSSSASAFTSRPGEHKVAMAMIMAEISAQLPGLVLPDVPVSRPYIWGMGPSGELGLGDGAFDVKVPTPIRLKDSISAIAMGPHHTVLLSDKGAAYSCGLNTHGQLGLGDKVNRSFPQYIHTVRSTLFKKVVVHVACGSKWTGFVTDTDEVYMCGSGEDGVLGLDLLDRAAKADVDAFRRAKRAERPPVALGKFLVKSFSARNASLISDGDGGSSSSSSSNMLATLKPTGKTVRTFTFSNADAASSTDRYNSSGDYTSDAETDNGKPSSSSSSYSSSYSTHSSPASDTHSVRSDSTTPRTPSRIPVAGSSSFGSPGANSMQRGINIPSLPGLAEDSPLTAITSSSSSSSSSPSLRPRPALLSTASGGGISSTPLSTSSQATPYSARGRGSGGGGQHSLQNPEIPADLDAVYPTPVPELKGKKVIQLSIGSDHALAVTSKGMMYTWGSTRCGQSGHALDDPKVLVPPVIGKPRLLNKPQWEEWWKQASCGDRFTVAIGKDANVYSWGLNAVGQLGHATLENVSEPRLVMSLVRVPAYKVAAGHDHAVVLSEEGRLYSTYRLIRNPLDVEQAPGAAASGNNSFTTTLSSSTSTSTEGSVPPSITMTISVSAPSNESQSSAPPQSSPLSAAGPPVPSAPASATTTAASASAGSAAATTAVSALPKRGHNPGASSLTLHLAQMARLQNDSIGAITALSAPPVPPQDGLGLNKGAGSSSSSSSSVASAAHLVPRFLALQPLTRLVDFAAGRGITMALSPRGEVYTWSCNVVHGKPAANGPAGASSSSGGGGIGMGGGIGRLFGGSIGGRGDRDGTANMHLPLLSVTKGDNMARNTPQTIHCGDRHFAALITLTNPQEYLPNYD